MDILLGGEKYPEQFRKAMKESRACFFVYLDMSHQQKQLHLLPTTRFRPADLTALE